MTRAWHFVRLVDGVPTLRDGRPVPPVGEWLVHEGSVELCMSGLHASERAIDALAYLDWSDAAACLVEVDDVIAAENDKLVCRRRRVLAWAPCDETLRLFARACALSAVHLWYAPEVVRRYLETGDETLRAAAWAAARVAALAAAGDAAGDAARAAAGGAAGDAARVAAGGAAGAAARAAQSAMLESMLLGTMNLEGL